jgi:hypothetical protein
MRTRIVGKRIVVSDVLYNSSSQYADKVDPWLGIEYVPSFLWKSPELTAEQRGEFFEILNQNHVRWTHEFLDGIAMEVML